MPSIGSVPGDMNAETHDRHSLVLLIALLFFLVLSAFVRDDWISEVVLVLSMYTVLTIAILKTSNKGTLSWPALPLVASCLLVTLICVFRPVHTLLTASWLLLSIFFGYVSVDLFSFLERSGAVIRAKLVACLGLYLMLGMFYYAIFNLIQQIHPGSFIELEPTPIQASRHSLLYLSLATLTTMGYGDVVSVWRPARMIAALEAVTGVFYVAITVARLVAARHEHRKDHTAFRTSLGCRTHFSLGGTSVSV
jgi:voltage-gated potassium channel